MKTAAIALCGLTCWASGCKTVSSPAQPTTPSQAAVKMAVLPALWVTPDPKPTEALTRAVVEGVRSNRGIDGHGAPVPPAHGAEATTPCQDDPECVRKAGMRSHASKVVVTKIAALGDTVLVRMTVVDVQAGTHEQTRQSVTRPSGNDSLQRAVRELAAQLSKPYGLPTPAEVPPSPWYERWWVWAAAGGVVATGVAVPLILRDRQQQEEPQPDVVITPP